MEVYAFFQLFQTNARTNYLSPCLDSYKSIGVDGCLPGLSWGTRHTARDMGQVGTNPFCGCSLLPLQGYPQGKETTIILQIKARMHQMKGAP